MTDHAANAGIRGHDGPRHAGDPERTWSYLGVLLLEAAVVAALWAFGAWFSR